MATLHATEMVEIQKILNQMCRKKGFTVWDSLSILSNLIPRQQKNRTTEFYEYRKRRIHGMACWCIVKLNGLVSINCFDLFTLFVDDVINNST